MLYSLGDSLAPASVECGRSCWRSACADIIELLVVLLFLCSDLRVGVFVALRCDRCPVSFVCVGERENVDSC